MCIFEKGSAGEWESGEEPGNRSIGKPGSDGAGDKITFFHDY